MSLTACLEANEQSLGPGLRGCPKIFDFTVKFEELFFSVTPAAVFISLSIWRLVVLARRPTIVHAPALQLGKLGAVVSYTTLELALVILAATRSSNATSSAISAAALRLAAAFCIIPLSLLENSRSPRPSVLLGSYLSLTLLLDAAQVRTLWLFASTQSEKAYASIFTTVVAIKAIVVLLEGQQKTRWVKWDTKAHSPEETSGIYSLGVYAWLNRLFFSGYRNVLQVTDLYPLDTTMASKHMQERFVRHYGSSEGNTSSGKLLSVLIRTFALQLILPVPARLALIGFKLSQPFFIDSLISYLSETPSDSSLNAGYGFIGASALIYAGIAISTALYWYFHRRMLFMLRGALIGAIYTKATNVGLAAGEDNVSVTLMSIDMERIYQGLLFLHEFWADLIEIALSSFLLYQHLGPAIAVPLVLAALCSLAVTTPSKYMRKGQHLWMTDVQKRVGLTSSAITNMKSLKISGLTLPIGSFIQHLRVTELNSSTRFRRMLLFAIFCAWLPFLIGPALTFGIAQRTLSASGLYTSLSFLLLMLQPLTVLGSVFPQLIAALACIGRIQEFLDSADRNDTRLLQKPPQEPSEKGSYPEQAATEDSRDGHAIIVENGSFGWVPDQMVLHNIHLRIPRASLTLIVGPIASGKSSLCHALLGEMPYSQGKLMIDNQSSRVGYCDQTPFLSNGTIRENIVGFSAFDANRYAEVIEATMLKIDCDNLPHGHDTNVGSNGITLSGGQKQRLSLARTLYLQTDLFIFDDVFSGLDADTEDQVFQRVFSTTGLLRRRGATAVLSTHSVRHLPNADHVVALGQDGRLVEQGSFTDLMAQKGYVFGLEIKSAASSTSDEKDDLENKTPSAEDGKAAIAPALATSVEAENPIRQVGDSAVYKIYFKSMGLFLTGMLFFLGLAFGFFNTFATVWLSFWTADSIKAIPSHTSGYYVGIYALYQVLGLISLFSLVVILFLVGIPRAGAMLHQSALTTLVRAPLRFFTTTDQGVVTNLFSQDLNLVDTELPNALLDTIYSVSLSLGQAAVLASSSPYLAISYPFIAGILYLLQKFYLRTSRQLRILDLETKSPLYTHFLDTTRGVITMRASGFVNENRSKNLQLLDTSQRPAYLLGMIQQWLNCVLSLLVAGLAVLLTALATQLRSSAGITGASLVTLLGIGENLSGIIQAYTRLETSIGAINRLRTFTQKVQPEDQDHEEMDPPEDWPQRGEIVLENVSASYWKDKEIEEPSLALKDLSLKVPAGQKVAVCGRTGSGKSSLIALFLKLLDPLPSSGSDCVKMDNLSLDRIDRVTLRRRIIAVPQEAVFLSDGTSIRENLDPFHASTLEDAETVIKTVGLSELVAERGGFESGLVASTLSQGQRQLFSLARAVLRRKIRARHLLGQGDCGVEGGLLLLDEVSSSVDQATEKKMQEIIREEFASYTVIAVSHRLDMIMDFDRVVVMDKGEIVEVGVPSVLAKEPGTRFGDLCAVGGH